MNPYDALNIKKNATDDDIKNAYRQKAKEHHPDAGGDPEKFHEITIAYGLLSDDKQKRFYDRNGFARNDNNNEIEHRAQEIINNIFHQGLEKLDADTIIYVDIVAGITDILNRNLETIREHKNELKKQHKKLKQFIKIFNKRLKHKKKTTQQNFFLIILNHKLESASNELQKNDMQERILLHAIKIMKDFSFDHDKPTTVTAYRDSSTTHSATFATWA